MRKLLAILVLVAAFAAGLGIGLTPTDVKATKCWTTCNNGVALECCRYGPIVNCRVLAEDC